MKKNSEAEPETLRLRSEFRSGAGDAPPPVRIKTRLENTRYRSAIADTGSLICGAAVTWESMDVLKDKKESQGSTIFGALGNILYRDRGFAISKPVTAQYYFSNPKTICLRTEYNGQSLKKS